MSFHNRIEELGIMPECSASFESRPPAKPVVHEPTQDELLNRQLASTWLSPEDARVTNFGPVTDTPTVTPYNRRPLDRTLVHAPVTAYPR